MPTLDLVMKKRERELLLLQHSGNQLARGSPPAHRELCLGKRKARRSPPHDNHTTPQREKQVEVATTDTPRELYP
jgi:hypothetical protein